MTHGHSPTPPNSQRKDAAGKPTFKRQQYWVDAPLQLQMVAYTVSIVAASLLLLSFSAYRGVQEASFQSHQLFHSLDWIKDAMRTPLLLASAIALLSSALLTLFWSHRFAGPLRVLAAGLARLRHGNFAVPVRIRATDAHQDLAKEFQAMQEELRRLIEADRALIAKAAGHVETARKTLEDGGRGADAELAKALSDLHRACAHYHL